MLDRDGCRLMRFERADGDADMATEPVLLRGRPGAGLIPGVDAVASAPYEGFDPWAGLSAGDGYLVAPAQIKFTAFRRAARRRNRGNDSAKCRMHNRSSSAFFIPASRPMSSLSLLPVFGVRNQAGWQAA